jgi:flagellar hook-length control protein FliK
MTASAINSAPTAPNAAAAGMTGANASAGPASGAAAGFNALINALFPQGADAPVPEAAAPGAPQIAPLFAPTPDVEDAPVEGDAQATVEGAPEIIADATADVASDAAAVLAAALVTPQTTTTPPAQTTTADGAGQTPHAWGRDKAKGAPAQPAILNASPNANLAGKAELATEALDETATPEPQAPVAGSRTQAAAASTAPRAPAQPAPTSISTTPATPAPAPATDASADVAATAPPPTPTAPVETAPPDTTSPALQAQALAAGQPPAKPEPAPAPRAARAERGKAAAETTANADLKPLDAADMPVHAKAVEAAGKAASAAVDAKSAEAAEPEAEVAADAPDASLPAETRAASLATAPAANTTHAVRGAPETVANLAAQIIKKLEGQSTRFDLELNPQGLGKVDVRVEIGAHGRLTASMLFDNAQSAQELKSRATELQRQLELAGFDLSGGLTFDVADQGRQGQAWQQQTETDSSRAFRGQAFRAALETAGDAADAAAQGALRLRRGVNAGLDLRI